MPNKRLDANLLKNFREVSRGLYMYWGGLSANVIWGKKYEKARRKRGKTEKNRKKGEK